MFDIGGWEFLLVAVIAIVVIGPKDLPGTIRTVTGWIRRARQLASEFQSGLDDIAQEADISSVKDDIQSGLGLDDIADAGNTIRNNIEDSIDPGGEFRDAFNETADMDNEDDPFLKDYLDDELDEDDELDDIDPKYKSPQKTASEPEQTDASVTSGDSSEPVAVPAETAKKA